MKLPQKALTNYDIWRFAKLLQIPYFRGVFMRDDLPKSGPKTNESGVLNLEDKTGRGTHWVAYKKRGNVVEYFDSFGNLKPPLEVVRYFKNCIINYNHDRYQQFNTQNCGHLCLKFLYK